MKINDYFVDDYVSIKNRHMSVEQKEFDFYNETDYALPMGFAYDDYYLEEDVKGNKKVDNLMVDIKIYRMSRILDSLNRD